MNATNTTTAASVATVGKSKIIDNWTALDSAVVEQMGDVDNHNVANACAWFALEECANKWTEGEEIEDEGRAE